jgi:hypothetical protein
VALAGVEPMIFLLQPLECWKLTKQGSNRVLMVDSSTTCSPHVLHGGVDRVASLNFQHPWWFCQYPVLSLGYMGVRKLNVHLTYQRTFSLSGYGTSRHGWFSARERKLSEVSRSSYK